MKRNVFFNVPWMLFSPSFESAKMLQNYLVKFWRGEYSFYDVFVPVTRSINNKSRASRTSTNSVQVETIFFKWTLGKDNGFCRDVSRGILSYSCMDKETKHYLYDIPFIGWSIGQIVRLVFLQREVLGTSHNQQLFTRVEVNSKYYPEFD